MLPPTRQQLEVLHFIDAYMAEHDCAPTRHEIAAGTGKSTTNATYHVRALWEGGLLTHGTGKHRDLELTVRGKGALRYQHEFLSIRLTVEERRSLDRLVTASSFRTPQELIRFAIHSAAAKISPTDQPGDQARYSPLARSIAS